MKARSILLIVSLAANGALVAVALGWPERTAPPSAAAPSLPSRVGDSATALRETPTPEQALQVAEPLWAHLDDPDPLVLMRRLLAAGFPRTVVSAVVRDCIAINFMEATRAVLGDELDLPYWRKRDARYDRQTRAVLNRMRDEDLRLTKEVTLEFLADDDTAGDSLWREYGVRDPMKQRQLLLLSYDYMEVAISARADNAGMDDRDTLGQAMQLIDKERLAEIAEFLTPEEYAEFELHQGHTAGQLRNRLSQFEATEDEFRALYAACAASPTSDDTETKALTSEQLLNAARSVLAADRYAELQQAVAPGTSKINRLVSRFGLPLSAATPVSEARQDIEQRAKAIRNDDSLSEEQKRDRLAALAAEARKELSAAFAPDLLAAYVECDGDWLVDLASAAALPSE